MYNHPDPYPPTRWFGDVWRLLYGKTVAMVGSGISKWFLKRCCSTCPFPQYSRKRIGPGSARRERYGGSGVWRGHQNDELPYRCEPSVCIDKIDVPGTIIRSIQQTLDERRSPRFADGSGPGVPRYNQIQRSHSTTKISVCVKRGTCREKEKKKAAECTLQHKSRKG